MTNRTTESLSKHAGVMDTASETRKKRSQLRLANASTACSTGEIALVHRRQRTSGPRYGCPGVGFPDFAILQWMAWTHPGSSLTSSAARTADTYPLRVDLACPMETLDAKNSDSVSVSGVRKALVPSNFATVDRAERYLDGVLGAHPRTPTAATRNDPTAAIAIAHPAAAALKVALAASEASWVGVGRADLESSHEQGQHHPALPQWRQSRHDQWGHWKCQCLNWSDGTPSFAHLWQSPDGQADIGTHLPFFDIQ